MLSTPGKTENLEFQLKEMGQETFQLEICSFCYCCSCGIVVKEIFHTEYAFWFLWQVIVVLSFPTKARADHFK